MEEALKEEKKIEIDEIFRNELDELMIKFRVRVSGGKISYLMPAKEIQEKIGVFIAEE